MRVLKHVSQYPAPVQHGWHVVLDNGSQYDFRWDEGTNEIHMFRLGNTSERNEDGDQRFEFKWMSMITMSVTEHVSVDRYVLRLIDECFV